MRKDFEKAKQLRLNGSSYNRISRELGVPKSTLSDWFGKIKWSQKIVDKNNEKALSATLKRLVVMHKARRKQLDEHYENARIEARKEFKKYRKDPLFIAGLCLYWGEGDKRNRYQLRIINSEIGVIRTFYVFSKNYLRERQFSANLFIYPDLDEHFCKNAWSKGIGLPFEDFKGTVALMGKPAESKVKYGMCNLFVSSRYLKEKMLEWLRLLEKEW